MISCGGAAFDRIWGKSTHQRGNPGAFKRTGKEHPGICITVVPGEPRRKAGDSGLLLGDSGKCLIVSSAIHGRESLNPALLLRMAEDYALIRENEYRDPGLDEWQELLTDYSIYFLPLMNPDGYEIALRGFSEIRNPLFGNIAAAKGILHTEWKENGRGVDINRNFPLCVLSGEGRDEKVCQ